MNINSNIICTSKLVILLVKIEVQSLILRNQKYSNIVNILLIKFRNASVSFLDLVWMQIEKEIYILFPHNGINYAFLK